MVIQVISKLRWARFRSKDKYGHYGAELVLLDDATRAKLKEAGIKVKFDADTDASSPSFKGYFIKARSETPVKVVDSKTTELPDNLIIGNDSVAKVTLSTKKWTMKSTGASGVKVIPLVVQIIDLKKYDPDAAAREEAMASLEEVEGFVFEDSTAATTAPADAPNADEIFR